MMAEMDTAPAPLFYLQDSRSYVGNDVVWWATDGKGYTTDVRKAHVYTKEDAQARHNSRQTDIPWPKGYIDDRTRPAVDMQFIKRAEALEGTGIVLAKPTPKIQEQYRCHGCGRLMSETQFWGGDCSNCGVSNRP